MLVKSKWNSYPKVVPPSVWTILQQRNERERVFLQSNLSQNGMETRARCVRGSVSECVSMRELNAPLGLYLKRTRRVHPRRGKPQWSGDRWKRWGLGAVGPGSADLWGRLAPGWAPWCPPSAWCFLNGYVLWKYGARPKVCSKGCPKYFFQRILKLKNYFWYFCEKGKLLEKFQHAENNFENFQICSGKKQMWCKENLKRRRK